MTRFVYSAAVCDNCGDAKRARCIRCEARVCVRCDVCPRCAALVCVPCMTTAITPHVCAIPRKEN